MKLASTTKKFIIATLSMASVVVAAGTFSDIKFNSASFMESSVKTSARLDDTSRNIASETSIKPVVLPFEMTEANIKRINGIWNIYNIVGDAEKINFNAKFELVGKGLVKIGGEQVYKISFLSDLNTIALFKEMSEGKYEIIEARKIETKAQMKKILLSQKALSQEGLTVNAQEIDLSVDTKASRLPEKFAGKNLSGSIRISQGMIVNFELSLNGEHALSFTEAVEIGDAGAFVASANVGQEVQTLSGIIINSGKDSYTLRIATGEFQGLTVVLSNSSNEKNEEVVVEAPVQAEEQVQVKEEVSVDNNSPEAQAQVEIQNERKAMMDQMDAQLKAAQENAQNDESKAFNLN